MSQHLPQTGDKKPEQHKIQMNLNTSHETQHKQAVVQNKHKEEDKHEEIHKAQDNLNIKIHVQPSQPQVTKQHNKKEKVQEENLKQTSQQRVDIVQLSPTSHKIQQPKIQAAQVISQVNIKNEEKKAQISGESNSQKIQKPKENEYKVQAQNQPRQANQVNTDQLKNKLNNEVKSQAITNKATQQAKVEKEQKQGTGQLKQSHEKKSSVEVDEKKYIVIQHKQQQKEPIKSQQHLPNKQKLGEQKKNATVPQLQQPKIQTVNRVQQPVKLIQQQRKVNITNPLPHIQDISSQKIEPHEQNQKIQKVISQPNKSECLQNKVQKQKQHKQEQPKEKNKESNQKQTHKPLLLKEQTPKPFQNQIMYSNKAEATDSNSINKEKQAKPSIQVEEVSVPVQKLETHQQTKEQIQPHEIAQEKNHSLETKIVIEAKNQQNKMPISKQTLKVEVQKPHQTNKIKQNISESKEKEVEKEEEQQITSKQKIRVHTQYIQSVTDENKQKEKKVVEFTQYVPTEQNENPHQRLQDIDKSNKVPLKTEVLPQKTIILQQQEQLKATFHPSYQSVETQPLNKIMKATQIAQNIIESRQSPKRQFGKIAKRTLYDKKVHEIVTQLNKFDEKKAPVPLLQPVKKSNKKPMDLSRLDTHIALKSNVMNLTIGELTSDDVQFQSSEKLLAEIESLKKKLSELQRKKEERMKKQQQQSDSPQKSESNAENSKFSKKQYTGRIIKKVQQTHSRLSQQIQPLVSNKKSEKIAIEPATISSASKNRITSTLGFQTQQQLDQLPQTDMSKTMAISFRVRRPSKNSQGLSQFQSSQKESAKKNRQRLDSDKCFQTSRREQVFEKLQFTEQESLTVIEKPVERQLKYEPYFREYIEKFFIELGKQVPLREMQQQEFVELAKKTYRKFGVNLQAQRSAALSVKKYKNCISFILDTNRTIIWYYEGKLYFGGWTINQVGEGQKLGWGYQYVPGKYVYSGDFKENKRDGYGIIKFLARQNDTIYQGNWSNGFKQGLGKQLEPDGVEYIGSWSQGKKHGYATLRISQCDYYSGYFILGIKNGEGTQVFKNGDRYVGSYKDGKFQGKGTYTWSNYSKYQGDFVEGIRNGYGFWIANYLDQNSDRYEGEYKNDKKNGYGVYKWKDGTTYQGQFLNDLKHGEGTVSYIDGRKATLQWSEGSVLLRPAAQKPQRNILKRGNSIRSGSQKSESRSRRFDAKLNLQNKSKGNKVFN